MRVCDLSTGTARLAQAFAQLKEHVVASRAHWNDQARTQFEQTHLQGLPTELQLLFTAVQRLSEVLDQAEKDCEERSDNLLYEANVDDA